MTLNSFAFLNGGLKNNVRFNYTRTTSFLDNKRENRTLLDFYIFKTARELELRSEINKTLHETKTWRIVK